MLILDEKESLVEELMAKERKAQYLDQLVSNTLRLVLLLPASSLIFLFGAWAYKDQSPLWWLDNIEPSIGLSLSVLLLLISFAILLGYSGSLSLHRIRVIRTCAVFDAIVKQADESHKPLRSMHGYASLKSLISRTQSTHTKAMWISFVALVINFSILFIDPTSELTEKAILVTSSLVILSLGQHMSTREHKFRMTSKDGLLYAYDPPYHPSTLELAFTELLRTHMDPILRSNFDDFISEFDKLLKPGVQPKFAREKLLMIIYRRRRGGLNTATSQVELSEILTDEGVQFVIKHSDFSEEIWRRIIDRSEKSCRAFYRLIDRLEQDLAAGRKSEIDGLVFDADIENVVKNRANMFCFFHNLSAEDRQIVVRVNSPDFRPNDLSLRYLIPAGNSELWPIEPVPLSNDGDSDRISLMSKLLNEGTVTWQTLLPEKTGDASVSIRIEDVSGDLLYGRQINVNVRPEFFSWIRHTGTLICYFAGGFGLITTVIMQALSVLYTT